MQFDTFQLTIISIIVIIGLITLGIKIFKGKKQEPQKEVLDILIEKIRPELFNMLKDVLMFKNVKDYVEFEDVSVQYLLMKIDELGILSENEKELIDDELVRGLVSPMLVSIWELKK